MSETTPDSTDLDANPRVDPGESVADERAGIRDQPDASDGGTGGEPGTA